MEICVNYCRFQYSRRLSIGADLWGCLHANWNTGG